MCNCVQGDVHAYVIPLMLQEFSERPPLVYDLGNWHILQPVLLSYNRQSLF